MKQKKLIIFGATGGTGLELVKQSLEQNYLVTAFVRSPEKLNIMNSNLSIVKGDVLDFESVNAAIKGQDVILSALGAKPSVKLKIRSDGTKNIIKAMKQNDIKRFICMTTLGIGDSKPLLPFIFKYILLPFLLKDAFADSEVQESYIFNSDLDWTIVRPGSLTNKEKTGIYQHGFGNDAKIKTKISRADVADFMLKQIDSDEYLNKTANLSY